MCFFCGDRTHQSDLPDMTRREALTQASWLGGFAAAASLGLIGGTSLAFSSLAFSSSAEAAVAPPRRLLMFSQNTKEKLDIIYWQNGQYISQSLARLSWFMRDYHFNQARVIDYRLFDLLYVIHRLVQANTPFQVLSGYRTPETNARLREESSRVARDSYHIKGKAIDIRLDGFSATTLQRVATAIKVGGVGYYPRDQFIHVDTGPFRRW